MKRIALLLLIGACSHASTPPVAPLTAAVPTATTVLECATLPAPNPVSPSLAVSDEILEHCRLELDNVYSAPKFDVDRTELLAADWEVLGKIARCITEGTLGDVSIELIGRADSRGTMAHNLELGARRAHAVKTALRDLGVDPDRIQEVSRGALDATGTNEATRAADRRVDIATFRPLPAEQ